MKLREIFDYLTEGELSQLSLGGSPGEIRVEDYPKLVRNINLALVNLFTRFSLKEGTLELVLDPDITRYVLSSVHAVSNTSVPGEPKYINDSSAFPYKDDLLKIQSIKTEDGYELALNVSDDPYSCTAPSHDVLEVPTALVLQSTDLPEQYKTDVLKIAYRAAHPIISTDGTINPDTTEVALPYAYLEPLLYFIAARAHHPSGVAGELNPATSYYAKYEQACVRLQNSNLDLDRDENSTKFRQRGWC